MIGKNSRNYPEEPGFLTQAMKQARPSTPPSLRVIVFGSGKIQNILVV